MTEEQEKGLSIYRQIENDLRWLKEQIEEAAETGKHQCSLVSRYNQKVDELDSIVRLYGL